ncbi:MAG: hypothetical protein WAT77_03215 [Paracoccaceae bacterium]
MPRTPRHLHYPPDRLGQVRVWMDAHGVDVLIIGQGNGAIVISAAHATECEDHVMMLAVIRLRWRQGRSLAIYSLPPDLSAQIEDEALQVGVATRHLTEDPEGRFRL